VAVAAAVIRLTGKDLQAMEMGPVLAQLQAAAAAFTMEPVALDTVDRVTAVDLQSRIPIQPQMVELAMGLLAEVVLQAIQQQAEVMVVLALPISFRAQT
jgi:hypothetical protein